MPWIDSYRSKITTAAEAVKSIKSGDRVYVHPGCATPEVLLKAMSDRHDELEGVEVTHLLCLGEVPYVKPGMEKSFRHRSLFTGKSTRDAVNEGRADWVPIFLSEIPGLFRSGQLPIDVALIHLTPPDEHGFCSFGVGVEATLAAAKAAKIVIAQVNPRMPRVHGDNFIHVNKLAQIVEVDRPIVELPEVTMTDLHMDIGRNVASLIEDGATLQMGIGAIPDAVLFYMKDKKDLGVHTEMFSKGVIDLAEQGIINNEKKTLHPGKIVASFVLAQRDLYDFMDNNPLIEFHPSDYVNDPFIISQNDNMVAINSAIEVDLTGQVCSDSMGHLNYSGIGGQVDFIRGAAHSKGGKPIIALPATARKGSVSRIALQMQAGAGVTTSRGDVHYVVTEYGVAYLHGKSLRERAKALIDIAHPDFREELERAAVERKIL